MAACRISCADLANQAIGLHRGGFEELFGSFVTGSAIEAAIAALRVSRDGLRTACVQLTDHGEAQAIVLGP
jgi:hypothetical protein